jgi:hypothetical protein
MRTLMAGLAPESYLAIEDRRILVASAGSDKAISFALESDLPADIRPCSKPAWLYSIEKILKNRPEVSETWLEVGISQASVCSIPGDQLMELQALMYGAGLRLSHITRVGKHDRAR